MRKNNIKKIIFASGSGVYGDKKDKPLIKIKLLIQFQLMVQVNYTAKILLHHI